MPKARQPVRKLSHCQSSLLKDMLYKIQYKGFTSSVAYVLPMTTSFHALSLRTCCLNSEIPPVRRGAYKLHVLEHPRCCRACKLHVFEHPRRRRACKLHMFEHPTRCGARTGAAEHVNYTCLSTLIRRRGARGARGARKNA